MILLIFGIYVIVTGKCALTKNYGLAGTGARIAGAICIAFGLGFFSLFSVPLILLAQMLGMGTIGVTILSTISQLVLLGIIMAILVKIYGNAFAQ